MPDYAAGPTKLKAFEMNVRHATYAKRILVGAMICSGGLLACISMAISLGLVPQLF
jgi:hypothetical protein